MATPRDRAASRTRASRHSWSLSSIVQELGRDRPLGELVDASPAAARDADDLAGVDQVLDGDLGLGPVPPRPAPRRSAEIAREQRAVACEARPHGARSSARGPLGGASVVGEAAPLAGGTQRSANARSG